MTPDPLLTSAEVRAVLGVGQNALTRYLRTLPGLAIASLEGGREA